jgi:pulcherriminic acid synthase
MMPIIRSAAESVSKDLVDSIVDESEADDGLFEFDLVEEFTAVYPITVTRAMLDVPDEMHDTVVRWYESIADGVADMTGSDEVFAAAMKTRDELREYFVPIIQERRQGDGEDLISVVAQAEVSGKPLTDEEICSFLSLIIDAGGETTDSALASLFKLLIEHPDQHREVFDDRSLVLDAVAEQLRHAPPVHIVLRTAAEEVEVEGAKIPKNAKIGMVLASGNRDPSVFADPDRFDVHRRDNDTNRAFRASADHISFADGRHFCVGNGLVREEVEIATNALFDAMAAPPRVAEGHEAKEIGYFYRAPHELQIAFEPSPGIRGARVA